METVKLFEKYYKRVSREGKTKAVICGLIVGFTAMFITALVFWLTGFKYFWLAIVPLVLGAGISIPLFYRFIFKPTSNAVAARIDELGLEERMITMNQYKDDNSYMAQRQREDAIKALGTVSEGLIKAVVSAPLVIALCCAIAFGSGMTTVSALASAGVISSGPGLFEDFGEDDPVFYDVTYEVQGEGEIIGEFAQRVERNKDAEAVMAVPADGYAFSYWSDGLEDPYRQDVEIDSDITVTAVFMPLQDGEGEGDGEGDGSDGDEGDKDGKPSDNDGNGQTNKPGQGSGQGGEYYDNDQIIDGEQDYGDYYEESKKDATDSAREDGNLTDDDKSAIDDYFNIIKK